MATDRDLCKACEDLKYNAPHFVANGLTDKECQSLMNNTGLDPKANHDDCEDLHDMQDCLMEGLKEDIPTYDDCDWKTAFTDLLTNLNNMFQAIICVICGLWDEIARLWNAIRKLQCYINNINNPRTITVPPGEDLVKGQGVSFHTRIDGQENPPSIWGNSYCIQFGGQVHLDSYWLGGLPFNHNGEPAYISNMGRLLWRWKLNKEKYHILSMYSAPAYTVNVGTETHCSFIVYKAGERTNSYNGLDHVGEEIVPEGYIYVDVRMHHAEHLGDGDVSIFGVAPIRLDNDFDC